MIIGITALALYDIRAFAFESNIPGVEGHATLLDNLLSDDYIRNTGAHSYRWFIILSLFLLGVGLLLLFERLESLASLVTFIGTFSFIAFAQHFLLTHLMIDTHSAILYIEIITLFLISFSIRYIQEENNKKFIRGAFSRYVSPAVVDYMLKSPDRLTVGGERKEVSILFSDIRGFTTLSEKFDPKTLSEFLNEYLGEMTGLIFKNEGTLDKYIGDAVMAFWGAPIPSSQHAHQCAQTALQMVQKLKELNIHFLEKYKTEISIGIGIHSGAVSVGNMGSPQIFEYTVIGDHVNLTSRLEGLTKYYGATILTTEDLLTLIHLSGIPKPPHRLLDIVKVKGKTQFVKLYEIYTNEFPNEFTERYHSAFQKYQRCQFNEAKKDFQAITNELKQLTQKEDGPSEMMIERCDYFIKTPPSDQWEGAWEMTSK